MKNLPLFALLKAPRNIVIFLCVSAMVFNLNYYLMSHLAGEKDLMCVPGGNLTGPNLIFAFFMGILTGMITLGFLENFKKRHSLRFKASSTSLLGLILGTLTAFCTLCTLPVLTLFSFSIGIGFITDYEFYLKLGSLTLLIVAMHLVNQEMIKGCNRCEV